MAAVLLAVCFPADQAVGAFTWLHIRKMIVKKEVRRHIIAGPEEDRLVLLKFSKNETDALLRWEHSTEFEYNGQMYDVVETWTRGDTVYYRCWWDREETRLNNRLRELAARALKESPKVGGENDSWSFFYKSLPFAVDGEWKIRTPELSGEPSWAHPDTYSSIVSRPPTPPPRSA